MPSVADQNSKNFRNAVAWLVTRTERTGRATVAELKSRFGLDALGAVEAIREAYRVTRDGGADATS